MRYGRRAFVKGIVCVSLSLLMSKNLKLEKVIKSFVPEPISSVFSDSYDYEHYEHFMNIMSISHIRIMGMLHKVSFRCL